MFKKGDRVKINPESRYFNREYQLPHGVVGVVTTGQGHDGDWLSVRWNGGHNSYHKEDLIKVRTFKGNK